MTIEVIIIKVVIVVTKKVREP